MLEIDLSKGETTTWHVDPAEVGRLIGGASLAARLLYEELTPDLDPLGPSAPLLFMTGPLTGTRGPAVGRYVVCGKSPATGLWGESNCGGAFGPELRMAGFDGLLLRGRAEAPVALVIQEGEVEIHPADHLWGRTDTYESQVQLKEELGDARFRVAAIGRAGETRIPFASILCDHGRLAGRSGMGAIMGSKGVKAIAVRGTGDLPIVHLSEFERLRARVNRDIRDDTVSVSLRETGTSGAANYLDYLGIMPKKYYTRGTFDGVEAVSGSRMAEDILSGVSTCHACVIACGRVVKLGDDVERKGPEHETIVGFGPNLLIDDLDAITMMGEWCDRYGMDTISLSNVIGLAYLMYERGIITQRDTGGLELEWGDAEAAQQLVHQTARLEGFGEQIAAGALGLGTKYGVPEMAVQVNGLEAAYHDPRGASGMALVYATSPRGACHNQSDYFIVEIGQSIEEIGVEFHSRQAGAEKAANVARHQDWRTVGNALVICQFANVDPHDVTGLIRSCTGFDFDLQQVMRAGERGWNLKRVINHRLGLSGGDDRIPALLTQAYQDGGAAGYVPPFEEMLAAYYSARGWDPETGKPGKDRLRELGLERELDDIW